MFATLSQARRRAHLLQTETDYCHICVNMPCLHSVPRWTSSCPDHPLRPSFGTTRASLVHHLRKACYSAVHCVSVVFTGGLPPCFASFVTDAFLRFFFVALFLLVCFTFGHTLFVCLFVRLFVCLLVCSIVSFSCLFALLFLSLFVCILTLLTVAVFVASHRCRSFLPYVKGSTITLWLRTPCGSTTTRQQAG